MLKSNVGAAADVDMMMIMERERNQVNRSLIGIKGPVHSMSHKFSFVL
jgi:hypothetical protein